jgi:hypothetical protein
MGKDKWIQPHKMGVKNFLQLPTGMDFKPTHVGNNYFVSSCGRVVSRRKYTGFKFLAQYKDSKGYFKLKLSDKNKDITIYVHVLVARAFCNGYCEGLQVNHIDGIKTNNVSSNLEWVTAKRNVQHAIEMGLFKASTKRGGVSE